MSEMPGVSKKKHGENAKTCWSEAEIPSEVKLQREQ